MKWFLLSADLYNNLNVPDAGTQRNGNSTKQKSADVLKIIFLMQDASFIKNIILSLFRLSNRRERKSKFSLFSVSEVEFSLLDSVLLTPPAWVAVSRDPCLFATLIPNNPLKVKPLLMCQSVPCQCVLWGCREACVQLTSFSPPLSVMLLAEVLLLLLLLLYLSLSSLPLARSAAPLTMNRLSTDSIWSDLRKRTGTITLFSFFRWVPSERRKEGRGEEVNKPSAFLQKNKETLDRHLHFSMK